jgi:hypothetical protein
MSEVTLQFVPVLFRTKGCYRFGISQLMIRH